MAESPVCNRSTTPHPSFSPPRRSLPYPSRAIANLYFYFHVKRRYPNDFPSEIFPLPEIYYFQPGDSNPGKNNLRPSRSRGGNPLWRVESSARRERHAHAYSDTPDGWPPKSRREQKATTKKFQLSVFIMARKPIKLRRQSFWQAWVGF